ncbi:MAG: endonuclease/exonuclease/phosphatase family protein [Anaerolineae bacterium]|nr:endonuclease/exonuclease/phosphatase family protein [Phycisphaerae bacterium]
MSKRIGHFRNAIGVAAHEVAQNDCSLSNVPFNATMRMFSYNILDGGEGRADPLAEVIQAQRADIVCIVEADKIEVIERIAHRLKMDCIHAPGRKSAAALLSRWAISKSINHALLRSDGPEKSFLEAEVIEPGGRIWTIGVVHLHAHARERDERKREQELTGVLDVFARHRSANRPHVLAGDFNANSPDQEIDPAKVYPTTRDEWHANGGQIPRRVVQRILDAAYVDTFAAFDPGAAKTTGTFTTQFPGQRVDYAFAFGFDKASIKDGWIEQDRLAKYASDHFPIGVEIV